MNQLPINEGFLQQLEKLQTLVKNNIAGLFGGNHLSKTFGSSCEFADYRDYMPGDDIKKIDWNAYARFDKLFYKLYYDERQIHTRIYIDASKSMAHGNGNKDKQAIKMACALAYLSVCEMDKVSIYVIKGNKVEDVILNMFGKENFYQKIGALNDIVFEGDSHISEAVLPSTVGYGDGLSVIISDFLTDNDFFAGIDYLVSKKRDVLCMQVLSQEELNPSIRGKMHLFDSENTSKFYRKNITKDIINAYKEAVKYVTKRVSDFCVSREEQYILVKSEDALEEVFFGRLADKGVLK